MTPTVDLLQASLPKCTRSLRVLWAFGMFDRIGLNRLEEVAIDRSTPGVVHGNLPCVHDNIAQVFPVLDV